MNQMLVNPLHNTNGDIGSNEISLIAFLPKLVVIVLGLTILVEGALPQLEMAITGGSVPFVPTGHALMILAIGSILLLKGRFQSSTLFPLTLALLGYFILEVIFLHFSKELSFTSSRRSLEYLVLVLIAGAASVVPLKIKARHILSSFVLITIACVILSVAQFVTNLPIVPTESADHTFQVESYDFFGTIRAFSLFGNALQAGIFYSLMGGVATSLCLRPGKRRFGLFLLSLCAFGCYATYTRLVMFGFILTVIAVFARSKKGLARFSLLFPIFSLGCAVLLIAQGLRTEGAGRNDLASRSSLDQRIFDWGMYAKQFMAGSMTDILFGTGLGPYTPYSKADRPENAAPVPVDNAYLLILLSNGIFGLVMFSVAYWHFWIFLHKRANSSRSHLLNGITAIFATVPFLCSISDPPTQVILLLLFAVSVDDDANASVALDPLTLSEQYLTLA
jgi:O-Antigen ligase